LYPVLFQLCCRSATARRIDGGRCNNGGHVQVHYEYKWYSELQIGQ
jgi:hypothetical protein